eukprot:TRINITY_DN8626_c0_g1_i6.p2 TRINITY_DN8626_c0_g1~~TRINITY_DN8626_c0_g1_i6.p2  ORF type:complete len:233 (+),score=28.81 TRINITY_DN8626_c0_g1_i6:1088-1786(+)
MDTRRKPCKGPWAVTSLSKSHTGSSSSRQTTTTYVPDADDDLYPTITHHHRFCGELKHIGNLSACRRIFEKTKFPGRLSMVTEAKVHVGGQHRYLLQFGAGQLSKSDGVGFVFNDMLPCKKDMRLISSIFVNQKGRICLRFHDTVHNTEAFVKALRRGDWLEFFIDLDESSVYVKLWPAMGRHFQSSTARCTFGKILAEYNAVAPPEQRVDGRRGHFACVLRDPGVKVTLAS